MTSPLYSKFQEAMKGSLAETKAGSPFVVAVSGGSDSMALCHLLKIWCGEEGRPLCALTVDHGLRAEAADEARLVGAWCQNLNIPHQILTGQSAKPIAGIQAYARDLRYGLMQKACAALGATDLFLGHQQEDQLETFLMRFSRGSGLSGLTAMSPVSTRNGLTLHRPLLEFSRQELRHFLMELGQDWIEDPSNEDDQYTRTATGHILKSLTHLPGASGASLALSLNRLIRADDALQKMTVDTWQEIVQISPLGFAAINQPSFLLIPREIQLRILERVLIIVSGGQFTPRLSELERLLEGDLTSKVTLGGCQIISTKEQLLICREAGREGLPNQILSAGRHVIWDHRFDVIDHRPEGEKGDLTVGPILAEGWREVADIVPEEIAKLPAVIRNSLPAVRMGKKIVSAPLIWPEIMGSGIARGQIEMVFKSKIVLN